MPSITVPIGPDGPIVTVAVAVSHPRQEAMKKGGLPIPGAQFVRGLIDTGASITCIDHAVITKLGIQPTGTTVCHSASHQQVTFLQYDVMLALILDNQQIYLASLGIPVIAIDTSQQSHDALIGRDVLAKGMMLYNGSGQSVSLTF
jgi:predicted aspartyl protease